jgi:hypothetical protein
MNASKILRKDVTLLKSSFKLTRHIVQGYITATFVVLNRGVPENSGILMHIYIYIYIKLFVLITIC